MALGSLIFIQIGLALSIGLVDRLGTNGAGWIRMGWAGLLMLLVFARPRRARFTRRAFVACFVLDVVTVGITLIFQAAPWRESRWAPRVP
ncbi:MAG: amino acid efflux protein [Mycobacterium sp.]|jgi:inner membrane transporter RhtA|nr:amino acid efflux protein [Mycobacterium sp.]